MKIVLAGTDELIALYLRDFLKDRGHEVFLVHDASKIEGAYSVKEASEARFFEADVVVNFPKHQWIDYQNDEKLYQNKFIKERIEPTKMLQKMLLKAGHSPKVWIALSSIYATECTDKNSFAYKNFELIKEWEKVEITADKNSLRVVTARTGHVLSRTEGILSLLIPLFKWGLGSNLGKGGEPFPWIYYKDLFWFVLEAIEKNNIEGVYSLVAPQMISCKVFSEALAGVMGKHLYFKWAHSLLKRRLGKGYKELFLDQKVFPKRLIELGFNFRYPAIYPALVDAFNSDR